MSSSTFEGLAILSFAVSGTGHRQDLAKIAEHAPHTEKAIFPTKDANWVATCVEYRPVQVSI